MEVYQKIDTLYKRYVFETKDCPNNKWLKMRNKIILGSFSNKEAEYLFNCLWEAYSKIDGTNSKIAFYPSTGEIRVGGKTDGAESRHGQFEMLAQIASKIQPGLVRMFPKDTAKFIPVKNKETNKVQYYSGIGGGKQIVEANCADIYKVELEEVPIYIYGEYFGTGVQKVGGRYIQNGNDFVVFDIRQQGWWLPRENRNAICFELGLKTVPYLGCMTLRQIEEMVMNGFKTKFENAADPTLLEEGIVARPTIPLFNGSNKRIIVKVKYCDYVEYDAVRKEFTDDEFNEFNKWYSKNIEAV